MIMKCTNCGGALTYDIISGDLKCKHCGSAFFVDEFENNEQEDSMLECNVFTCKSCAAQLMINDNEAATYCAYCGQPTIVFDRIDKMKRPQKIIPFSVTKENAISIARKKFKNGFFVPDEIKNFEVERMTGIYVPFWLYDVYYYDKQKLRGKSGKHYHDYYREADANFSNLTVDASSNFSNYSSQQLEPYHTNELKNFCSGYLSGFYADQYDDDVSTLQNIAIQRCQNLFNAEVQRSTSASDIKILESRPSRKVNDRTYALLPAWFMTIRYKNEPYTILINGQTGKLTGAVPLVQEKVFIVFIIIFIILTFITIPVCISMLNEPGEELFKLVIYLLLFGIALISLGIGKLTAYKTHVEHTTSKEMETFAQDRQRGE